MAIILPVGSGKGGTGKTVLSANLGVVLAQKGKKVILVDLDLGGANLHTCLGIKNDQAGIGDYIYKRVENLGDILMPAHVPGLYLIAGDVLLPGTANLDFGTKKKIIRNIARLDADYVLLDLGAGTTYNTIDFFLMSPTGLIVTSTETTSILNAYSFMKAIMFRLLYLSFPAASNERKIVFTFLTNRMEKQEKSFLQLLDMIAGINPGSASTLQKAISGISPRVVINMGSSMSDVGIGEKLKVIARKNLGMDIRYIGFVPRSSDISVSIIKRQPACLLSPNSDFSRAVNALADKIISGGSLPGLVLYETDDADIEALTEQIRQIQQSRLDN